MTDTPKKRGRPPKVATVDAPKGALTVKVANMLHDGQGGFYPVGHKFDPVTKEVGELLKARGLVE
jgi:hypothetical protein